MKILIVCPSNREYMPYLDNYVELFNYKNIRCSFLVWNRMNKKESADFIYNDNKKSLRRNFYDYLKFSRYVKKIIRNEGFDFVLLFSIQLSAFLGNFISKELKNKYILDIRDYHKIIRIINIKKYVKNSYMTVVSSEGFKKWMPKSEKIIVNHNTSINTIREIDKAENIEFPVIIGTIGSLKHIEINKKLISTLGNNEMFKLIYDGYGTATKALVKYAKDKNIKNIMFTGEYKRKDEKKLYMQKDIISVIYDNHGINNLTLLPNRLYNGLIYGKPLIAMNGTYLADIMKDYQVGLVLDKIENIESELIDYVNTFDRKHYDINRKKLLKKIIEENYGFQTKIHEIMRGC